MSRSFRTIVSLIALLNLFVAVMLAREAWLFHKRLDQPGWVAAADDVQKTKMLRVIYYWGIPPMVLLTAMSGVLLWRLKGEKKS